jgi:hypothetical protein
MILLKNIYTILIFTIKMFSFEMKLREIARIASASCRTVIRELSKRNYKLRLAAEEGTHAHETHYNNTNITRHSIRACAI